jgi:predicted transcriptional regulator
MPEFRRTTKQTAIVEVILAIADAGREASLEEIRTGVEHGKAVSKQAIRSSLRYLAEHGFITSRREGLYTFYTPTLQAYATFRRSV